jgi:hypothetical protein
MPALSPLTPLTAESRPLRRRRLSTPLALLTGCGLVVVAMSSAHAQHSHSHSHSHGEAKLEVAVEPQRIHIRIDAALDGFVGFERAPRNNNERQRVQAAETQLRDAAAMFAIDPAAGCEPEPPKLEARVLGWGGEAGDSKDGHADLEADYVFNCTDATRASYMNVGLFSAFNRMRRIEVQAVTPQGQMKVDLRRPNGRVALVR